MDIRRIDPGPYLSSAVVAGDFVYLAGLIADDLNADVAGQTAQILRKIDHYLKEAGSDKSRIVQAQIWLRDIAKWGEMNEVCSDNRGFAGLEVELGEVPGARESVRDLVALQRP